LNEIQKTDKVGKSYSPLRPIWSIGLGVLDTIVTMGESAVSLHMPETKRQSK
jgi:hypothetical protein